MTTEKTLKTLSALAPIISKVLDAVKTDEKILPVMEQIAKDNADNSTATARLLPVIYEVCGDDLYKVVSVCADKTVEEVKTQDATITLGEVKAIMSDEGLTGFFALFFGNEAGVMGSAE